MNIKKYRNYRSRSYNLSRWCFSLFLHPLFLTPHIWLERVQRRARNGRELRVFPLARAIRHFFPSLLPQLCRRNAGRTVNINMVSLVEINAYESSFFPTGNEVVEHVKTFVEVRLKKSASEKTRSCEHASPVSRERLRSKWDGFPVRSARHFQFSDYQSLRPMVF